MTDRATRSTTPPNFHANGDLRTAVLVFFFSFEYLSHGRRDDLLRRQLTRSARGSTSSLAGASVPNRVSYILSRVSGDRSRLAEGDRSPTGAPRRLIGDDAIERLVEAASRVLAGHPGIIAAYLYGSAARGEPAADLDIAVLTSGVGLDARALQELAARLQAEGGPGGIDLDMRPLAGTTARFRANVLREGRLLYESDRDARLAFEARALSEWLDFKPVWERMRRRMFERWANG